MHESNRTSLTELDFLSQGAYQLEIAHSAFSKVVCTPEIINIALKETT